MTELPERAHNLIRKLRTEVKIEKARRVGAVAVLADKQNEVRALRAELEALRSSAGE